MLQKRVDRGSGRDPASLSGRGPTPGSQPFHSYDDSRATSWAALSPRRQAYNHFLLGALSCLGAWLQTHWLLILNVMLGAFVGVALLVPVLYAAGLPALAAPIFRAYHLACAQLPSHSYFLLGYQVALCARNLAIFGSLFVGSLAYRWVRTWLLPLDWRWWVLTLIPMAWDGGTQLVGWRESTWELRTLTGMVFGLGVCWFVLPILHGTATEQQ